MGLLSEGCWGYGTEPGTRQAYGHDSVTTQQLYKNIIRGTPGGLNQCNVYLWLRS